MPKPLREGSVAWHRAQGTNKGAGGPGKDGTGPSKPKPSPSPSPSPKPLREGSVAWHREQGTNKGAGGPGKAGNPPAPTPSPTPSPSSNWSAAKDKANSHGTVTGKSVSQQREEAAAAGLTMKEYKNKNVGGSGSSNTGSLSPWQKFSKDFDAGGHQSYVDKLWDDTSDVSGLKKGPKFQGAQMGPNGFIMDANAPMVLPQGVKQYGFKPGDQFFDAENYTPHAENASMHPSMGGAITGKIAYFKPDGTAIHEVAHDANPNWDKYQDGQERMSSEGLYQDRYNVGYHGPDDQGDMYASNAAMGSIKSYFDDYNKGEQDFSEAYHNFVNGDRTGGYAGDVLKMIDQGRMKVTDDQYNRIVIDAQNYDWDKRNEIAGRDAGQASYDARVGGMSQSSINANKEWQDRQDNMGLQTLQDTADIGGGNASSSLEANQPFGYQYTPSQYQRKYDLGAQGFMTNWMDTRFS